MRNNQKKLLADWIYPVGTAVIVRKDDGSHFHTKTRSMPWLLSGHTAVILVEGISGCYALERLTLELVTGANE